MARKKNYQWDTTTEDVVQTGPSRSQKKRDSTALQALGKELTELPLNKLEGLPLSADLLEALQLMARITDREGKRRQLQYIGRLMRESDSHAISAALTRLKQGHVADTTLFHHAEQLRSVLMGDDAAAKERIFAQWPQAADDLRKLVTTAKTEDTPHASRALFRQLRKLLDASPQH